MSWAKFDDQYPDHPKIVEVGPLGLALHAAATCYCARYLTNGFVPTAMMNRLVSFDGISINNNAVTNKEITDKLIQVGLIEIVPGGYLVHDYLEYNPPAEQVKAERERNRARQAEFVAKHRNNAVSNHVSNAINNHAPSPSPSPYPSPYQEEQEKQKKSTATTPYIRIFSNVTGMIAIPGDPSKVFTALDGLMDKYKDEDALTEYLKPYFQAWIKTKARGGGFYSKTNPAWLDWAIAGEIPPKRDSKGKVVSTSNQQTEAEAEAIAREMGML